MKRFIFLLIFSLSIPAGYAQGKWAKSDIVLPDDLRRAIDFHGHLCPGLIKGYKAVRYAQADLQTGEYADADLTPVVENQKCGVDAIQALLAEKSNFGNTWGNGFRGLVMFDYGKDTWIFIRNQDKHAIRLSLIPGSLAPVLEDAADSGMFHQQRKMYMRGLLPPPKAADFIRLMEKKTLDMLKVPDEKMFKIRNLSLEETKTLINSFPQPASRIPKRFTCTICGEGVINFYHRSLNGMSLCIPCYEKESTKQKTSALDRLS